MIGYDGPLQGMSANLLQRSLMISQRIAEEEFGEKQEHDAPHILRRFA